MYFLAQGGEVTGPFGEGRILQMGDAGELTSDAQVAMQGSEDWFPADDLLTSLWAERKEREAAERRAKAVHQQPVKKKRKPINSLWYALALIIVLIIAGKMMAGDSQIAGLWLLFIAAPVIGLTWLITNHLEHTRKR